MTDRRAAEGPAMDPDPLVTVLVLLGTAMVATGQTVGEVEDELTEVSAALGRPDPQIAASPTGITVSLAVGAPASFAAVRRHLRLDQAAEVRLVRHQLLSGSVDLAAAAERLRSLPDRPPAYPRWTGYLGWLAISAGIAAILQPAWPNVAVAAAGGLVVAALHHLGERVALIATLLPTLAAFTVSCGVFAAAEAGWLEGPLRTLLPPLAVLLPGALLVTAMAELAAGDMVAGAARLTYGSVQLLLFAVGIVAAVRLLDVPTALLSNLRVDRLGPLAAVVGLVAITLGIALLESPPLRLLPWIGIVLVLAFLAQTLGQGVGGPALGSFAGALAASLGAYLVEAVVPDLPRLVVFLPAFWLLVPGSLGVLGTTQLAVDPGNAVSTAVGTVGVVAAIALGLLVGTAVAGSVRGVTRRPPRT